MKKLFAFALAALLAMMAAPPLTALAAEEMKDSGLNYTESTAMLPNPFMGYPNRGYAADGGFLMQEGGASTIHVAGDYPGGFTWYYIDLKAFSAGNDRGTGAPRPGVVGGVDKPISQAALNGFEQALVKLRQNGGSALMRFVYDTNGVQGCEPDNFDMAITHLKQLCGVVSKYPDIVQGFECGIIGVYGEMHSSKYNDRQYVNRVIDAYLDNTPDSMVLLLRSPGRIADYLGITTAQLAALVPEKGSRAYRLGYYNDGYMNSDSDLGTWMYNRALETDFLARGNTPYGGEYGSAYDWIIQSNSTAHLPQNAILEMYKTHVSFIRGNVYKIGGTNTYFGYDQYTYGPAYEKPGFPDNSAFYGANCHSFITAHLGYRLVLRESKLSQSPQAGGGLRLQGRIENTGFANILHNPAARILLVKDGAVAHAGDVSLDASNLRSCTTYRYDLSLSLPAALATGDYDVYLQLAHVQGSAAAKSGIRFANNGGIFHEALGANKLGTVTVAAAGSVGPTDLEAVAAAKAALTWDSIRASNTAQNSVTANLVTLPVSGLHGAAISWSSSNAAISNTGIVTRPSYGAGSASVTLAATITKGTASDAAIFSLTVPELPDTGTPIQVSKDFDVLNVRKSGKITAPGASGFTSSNPAVASIDSQGNVTGRRPGSAVIAVFTPDGQGIIEVTVKYSFWQWLLVIFLFGWRWL